MYNNLKGAQIRQHSEPENNFVYHVATVTLPNDDTMIVRSSPRNDAISSLESLYSILFALDDTMTPSPETPAK